MKNPFCFVPTCLALLFSGLALDANACSTDAWDVVSGGGIVDSPLTVSRYSEQCALQLSEAGYVQSNRASDRRYIARFYVLNGFSASGDVPVFQVFADEAATAPLFAVSLDGALFTFDATDAGGGQGAAPAASGWNLVELDWDSIGGTLRFWVNADARTDPASGSVDSGSGTVEAVRLGMPEGIGGQAGALTFDAFESRRSTPVGGLIDCDADGSGATPITAADVSAVVNERFGAPSVLAAGQPDCNLDGDINLLDILATIERAFPPS